MVAQRDDPSRHSEKAGSSCRDLTRGHQRQLALYFAGHYSVLAPLSVTCDIEALTLESGDRTIWKPNGIKIRILQDLVTSFFAHTAKEAVVQGPLLTL